MRQMRIQSSATIFDIGYCSANVTITINNNIIITIIIFVPLVVKIPRVKN